MTLSNAKSAVAVCPFARRVVLPSCRSFGRQLLAGSANRLTLAALAIFAIFSAQFLFAQRGSLPALASDPASPVCPANSSSASRTLNVPEYHGPRASVGGDYVVIEYNANSLLTSWSDYKRFFDFHGQNNLAHRIDANGSFLPVIDAKEKIAVRVCGLHFTDAFTVTTSPTGVPEGGADIRGATPVAPPTSSLSSTLDTLQSGTTTGGTTALPGLGLGSPTALPPLSISGIITPGAMGAEDQTPGKYPAYTPAQVTASGKQVALLLFSMYKNAAEISRLIDRTMGRPYDAPPDKQRAGIELGERYDARAGRLFGAYGSKSAPGSVNGVAYTLGRDLATVSGDSHDLSNAAAFDKDMAEVQNVNAQISTLAGALTSQAFASNTLLLLTNYSTLRGVLDLARLGGRDEGNNCQENQASLQPADIRNLGSDDLKSLKFSDFSNWTPSQLLLLSKNQIGYISDSTVQGQVRDLQKALDKLGVKTANTSGDQPLCSAFEKQKYDDFWSSYNDQAALLCSQEPICKGQSTDSNDPDRYYQLDGTVGGELFALNDDLNTLRSSIGDIDAITAQLYDTMNEWYEHSSVEQTDLLQPLTANAFLRISIVVQRGYTPFTLANAGGTFTPAASTNAVPTAVAAASTSTPAHAVKTILIEVHRVANFNLMGGVMLIHVPTTTYGLQPASSPAVNTGTSTAPVYAATCAGGKPATLPTPSNGVAPSYSCVVQTQQTQWQVAGMAGLVWFPWGHDYFPRHSGYANYGRNLLPSMLLATSVTSLGNSMGGVNWEPVSGLDFYAGVGSAHKTSLPSGLNVNSALESGSTLSPVTSEHVGFTIGVGFDLTVITQLFGSKPNSAATMP